MDTRTIQRDIDDIRAWLSEHAQGGDVREIIYDRKRRGFVLTGGQFPMMTNGEILGVSKILLESRAFPKQKMKELLDKLVSGCVPQRNMKLVSDLLANEAFHYVELQRPTDVQETLWALGEDIRDRFLMELTYRRQDVTLPPVKRVVEPVSIIFSEYYFYLNAWIVEPDERGEYRHVYDFPAIFRVDRITEYALLKERFTVSYADRFQEGAFRKRVQFMYPGELIQLRFRYTGPSVEAVLDRLPTAQIQSQDESGYVIRAEVYGKGILMWLLSQADRVEILSPESLREEFRELLRKMMALYDR